MLERSLKRWTGLQKTIETVSPAKRAATPEEVANFGSISLQSFINICQWNGLVD
jgi:hypothetical protein